MKPVGPKKSESKHPQEGKGKIFVLSVAINKYQSRAVSNLKACLKDARQLKSTLQDQFAIPDEHLKILSDETATRRNIIQQFREHFGRLKDGDTAVFHYSGHGSWEEAGPEFIEAGLEPYGGRNEVLVVHDYGKKEVRNIADKELRYLIAELQLTRKIHFVGLMDCCFSGTIFREEELTANIRRTTLDSTAPRPLDQYLEGQYAQQYAETGTLSIPEANFILFSACGPKEYALEDKKGGLFTQALTKVFENLPKQKWSYADAFFHIRNTVQYQSGHRQNPYFEYVGEMNPFQQFLGAPILTPNILPSLHKKGKEWITNIGVLHGMSTNSWEKKSVPIFQKNDYTKSVGQASIQEVGLEHSLVQATFYKKVPKDVTLQLALHGHPLPIILEVAPGAEETAKLLRKKMVEKGMDHQAVFLSEVSYRLVLSINTMAIYKDDDLIIGIETREADFALDFIINQLQKVIRWEQVNQLSAPKRSRIPSDAIAVEFSWYPFDHSKEKAQRVEWKNEASFNSIFIPFSEKTYIFYDIKVENRDLYPSYCYLVHLSRTFGISQKLERFIKPLRYEDHLTYDSKANQKALAITDQNLTKTTDIFLVLFTREPLYAPFWFEQSGMGDLYGKMVKLDDLPSVFKEEKDFGKMKMKPLTNWTLKRLEVTLERP